MAALIGLLDAWSFMRNGETNSQTVRPLKRRRDRQGAVSKDLFNDTDSEQYWIGMRHLLSRFQVPIQPVQGHLLRK